MNIFFPQNWDNRKRAKWAIARIMAANEPLAALLLVAFDCQIGEDVEDLERRIDDIETRIDSASLSL